MQFGGIAMKNNFGVKVFCRTNKFSDKSIDSAQVGINIPNHEVDNAFHGRQQESQRPPIFFRI